jgi:nitrogen fixation NifU-like protein
MDYSKRVIDLYENPKNVGEFDENDENVGTSVVGAPSCGDVIKLQIKVGEDGSICDAKFKAFGCGAAIASSSLITDWISGKSLDEARTIKNHDVADYLSLPPVKVHCSVLAEEAVNKAIDNYLSKKKVAFSRKNSSDKPGKNTSDNLDKNSSGNLDKNISDNT